MEAEDGVKPLLERIYGPRNVPDLSKLGKARNGSSLLKPPERTRSCRHLDNSPVRFIADF